MTAAEAANVLGEPIDRSNLALEEFIGVMGVAIRQAAGEAKQLPIPRTIEDGLVPQDEPAPAERRLTAVAGGRGRA